MRLTALICLVCVAAAPATRPTTQEADLRRIIATLQQQVAQLKAENAKLKRDMDGLVAAKPKPVPQSKGPLGRPSDPWAAFDQLKPGMTLDEVKAILGEPGGPGTPGLLREEIGGRAEYFWNYAPDSRTMGVVITVRFEDHKLANASRAFQ